MLVGSAQWEAEVQAKYKSAGFYSGPQSREAGVSEILERMRTGRFYVFNQLDKWLEEKRMLYRDGNPPKIVAINDDLESATRYAIMMSRFAMTETEAGVGMSKLPSYDREAALYDPLASFSRT